MASASKSTTLTSAVGGTYTLSASFVENSTSIPNNTSNITVSGTIARGSGRFSTSGNHKLYVYWHDNKTNTDRYVAEQTVPTLYDSGASATASATFNVEHKADGTLSGYAWAQWSPASSANYMPHAGSVATDNTALTNIPRAPSYTSTNSSSITEHSVRLTGTVDTHGLSITDGGWDISTDGGATGTYHRGDPTDKTITGLEPGTKYWYKGYVVTSGGWANSSWKTFTTKDCVVRKNINSTWKTCVPYKKINGTWKKCIPYIKVNGTWKEGIN